MQRLNTFNAMQRNGRTINFSCHWITVGGVSGRYTRTDSLSTNRYEFFAHLLRREGAETEVNISSEKEGCMKAQISVIGQRMLTRTLHLPKLHFLSRKRGHSKRHYRQMRQKIQAQVASQCKELAFPSGSIANINNLANKNFINPNTSAKSTELPDNNW